MIWIELLILLACIIVGARLGGIALGTVAGIGLAIFVFIFALPPGGPPQTVIGMIIAVITALSNDIEAAAPVVFANPQKELLFAVWCITFALREGLIGAA